MKRNYGLDLMRIFLCLCVIAVHSINFFGIENDILATAVTVFFLQANGVFYMVSGYFNLEKEFNNSTDIKKYYKNKVINVLFPYAAFLLVWAIWDYMHVVGGFDILEILGNFYSQFMETAADSHLWFMYPLFGLLLATPFLSKMLHHMDEKELKMLWYIALGWNVVCIFLCYDFGMDFLFDTWFMSGWALDYVAGYCYRHAISKESKVKWTILGILGFVLTNCGILYLDTFDNATNFQVLFTIFCMACLMFWDKAFNIKNAKVQKVISFFARYTFLIYLFHMRGMEYALRKLVISEADAGFGTGMLVVFATFICSLIASIAAELLMKPVKMLLNKVWKIKE